MQKFTRALTREIEVGGERLAITFSQDGLSVRPVGSRRTPHTMTWAALACACTGKVDISDALQTLKSGPLPGALPPTQAMAPQSKAADSLPDLLGRIDRWIEQHRPRFRPALMPGATPEACRNLEQALGRPLPENLRTWLTWHNGQSPDVVGAFVESWNLMCTEEIPRAKSELDAEARPGWQKAWIPFLDDDQDDYVCLDPSGTVHEVWRGREQHPAVAPSLTAWAADLVTELEAGIFVEDPERGEFRRGGG
jgi:cell wall assembly regulator SMI1